MSEFKKAILQIEEALAHQSSQFEDEISGEMALVENNESNINKQRFEEIQAKVSDLRFHFFDINTDNLEQLKETIKNNSDNIDNKLASILRDGCDDDKCPNCPDEVQGVILSPQSLIDLLRMANG
jgi:hypothetical protein